MAAVKGRLKVALLVVGFLVAGLGMYGAFQPHDAEAHGSSWQCPLMKHKKGTESWSTVYELISNVDPIYEYRTCPNCKGMPPKWHTKRYYKKFAKSTTPCKHKPPVGGSWSSCDSHVYYANQGKEWRLTHCGG